MPSLSYVSVTRLFEIVGTQSNKPVFCCRFLLSAFTVCNNCVYCKKYLSKTLPFVPHSAIPSLALLVPYGDPLAVAFAACRNIVYRTLPMSEYIVT